VEQSHRPFHLQGLLAGREERPLVRGFAGVRRPAPNEEFQGVVGREGDAWMIDGMHVTVPPSKLTAPKSE
jgi:hypothetical protein